MSTTLDPVSIGPPLRRTFVATPIRTEKNGEAMYSDDFTIKGPREKITKWHVELYPRGKIGDALEYVSVFLQNKTAVEVVANCVVSTLDANKVKQKIFENLTKFRRQGIMGSNKGGIYKKKNINKTPFLKNWFYYG